MIKVSLLKGIDKRVVRFKRQNPGKVMTWDKTGFEALKLLAQANHLSVCDSFMYMGVRHEKK